MGGPRVIVVGAGFAGLAAARRLREGGAEVVVLEAGPEPGGLARGEAREGFALAAAPKLVSSRDRALLGLLAGGDALPLRPVSLAHWREGSLERVDRARRDDRPLLPGVPWWERRRLVRLDRLVERFSDLLDPHAPERAVRLDDRSAADFVRLYVGRSAYARWAEPMLAADLRQDAAETSRALFMLHARERRWAPIGLLRGAPGTLAASLVDGLDVRCGERVGAVSAVGGALRVEASGAFEADACVLAVAPRVALACASPLLSAAERTLLSRRTAGPSFTLSLALSRSLRERVLWVRVPRSAGLPLAGVLLEPSGERAPAPEGGELATAVASADFAQAQRDAPGDLVEKALREALARVLPDAEAALRFTRLWRQPEATPRFPVGAYRDLASFRAVQRDLRERGRRLYFAGAALVTPTLEGAVASGQCAADEVLSDLGRSVRS